MQKPNSTAYDQLIDHMNEAVWIGDKDERTVFANKKFCQLIGYSLEEMIGQQSYFFWDEESKARVEEINLKHRKNGISSTYEGNLINKYGQKTPVFLSGAPLPCGGTIGIMTDMTEMKMKEKQEKILKKSIQFSKDAIVTFDPDGIIHSWNEGAKSTFGYKVDEVLSEPLSVILFDSDFREILNSSEIRYNFELSCKHKNKQKLVTIATITPIFDDENKEIISYSLIARDVTNELRFEEELALKYKKMKDAYNQIGIIRRQMDYTFELLESFNKGHGQKEIANFIVGSLIMLTRADACVLRMYNKSKGTQELIACAGVAEAWQGKSNIKYENSITQKAFKYGAPMKVIDISKEPRHQSKHLATKHNLTSLLLTPLTFKSELIGSLSIYSSPEKKLEIFENEFIEKYAHLIEMVLGTSLQLPKTS